MSIAENLLNSISEDAVATVLESTSTDGDRIIIDGSRNIIVPKSLRNIAVTGDKDVETILIQCVRFWDNHDLSEFAIYLNYTLPNGEEGTYIPSDIQKLSDSFLFNWTIGREMTSLGGPIAFSIVAKQTDADGVVLYQWGSLINRDCSIASGLPVSTTPDIDQETDLISKIVSELNQKISIDRIVDEQGLSDELVMSQKATTTAISPLIVHVGENEIQIDQNATAIANINTEQEIISKRIKNLEQGISPDLFVTDTSPFYEKIVPENALPYAAITMVGGATRSSKNLIPYFLTSEEYPFYDTTKTINGITFTDNLDGTVTANGTSTGVAAFYIFSNDGISTNLPAGNYYISGVPSLPTGNTDSYITVSFYNEDGTLFRTATDLGQGGSFFYLPQDAYSVRMRIRLDAGTTWNNALFKPMLSRGSSYVAFEPYYEGVRQGKVTKIESRGTDGTIISQIQIPQSVLNLDGYGQGNPENEEEYNYIDFETQKFIKNGILMDGIGGTHNWVKYDQPEEQDVELTKDNFIEVVGGGSVLFVNESKIGVPSEIIYMTKEETT